MVKVEFAEFIQSLTDFGASVREDQEMRDLVDRVVHDLHSMEAISEESLAYYITVHPDAVPVLAMCAGLGQEQLKNQLKHRFDTSGWIMLARTQSRELIAFLNQGYGLVANVADQLNKRWELNDVLLERHLWSRRKAVGAQGRGRSLEDAVEGVVSHLKLPYTMRTVFTGRGGESAPCDLAIPAKGSEAKIAVAIKGFNSTGSKLTDAVREIQRMVDVRTPNVYLFAIVDGIGWKSRQRDLQRIFALFENQYIDGLYNLNSLGEFERDIISAATRLGLL